MDEKQVTTYVAHIHRMSKKRFIAELGDVLWEMARTGNSDRYAAAIVEENHRNDPTIYPQAAKKMNELLGVKVEGTVLDFTRV